MPAPQGGRSEQGQPHGHHYFRDELEQELAQLPAEMLLDFIGKEIGAIFYNRGVQDAQQLVQQKAEDVVEALYGLERSVSIR